MDPKRQKPPLPWPYIGSFLFFLTVVVVLGFFYNKYQKNRILIEKQQELSAITDLKVTQIENWRKERIGFGNTIRDNESFNRLLKEFAVSDKGSAREHLISWMTSLTINFDFKSVLLLDKELNVKLSIPAADSLTGGYFLPVIPDVMDKHKVVLTDLHRTAQADFIHTDLLIPVLSVTGKDTISEGLILIRIDPERALYPIIEAWPNPGRTSEALIVREENDSVLFLNNLRHQDNTALRLKIPVTNELLPASAAISGFEGVMSGYDYRDVRVLASVKKVSDSQWFLVVKTDEEEVFADFTDEMFRVNLIILLFILTTASVIGLLWRNQRVRYYRGKYEVELDRLALIKHFDYILKYANDIILLYDKDFVIIEANDRALETYQYSRDELIGMNLKKLCAPDTQQGLKKRLKEIEEIGFLTFETMHKRKDETVFFIEESARIVSIEGTNYIQSIGRDITERKQVEENLRESEERFRKIFEESPMGIVMTDKDFSILRANTSFCKMMGFSEEELLYSTFHDFTHPDYIYGDELSIMKLVKGEISIYHTEKRYIRKDKSVIWGSTTVSLIRNNMGDVLFFMGMVEDITSRRSAEEQTEKSLSLLRATLESTADGILFVDNNSRIIQYNKKFREMWNVPEEIMAEGFDEVLLEFVKQQVKDPEKFLAEIRDINQNEDGTSTLLEFKDGRFFERYSQPQKISEKSVGRVWSFHDITKSKIAEANLILAKEKAEESDKLKTAFLHNISHEIRTPMNAIIGFSTLLNEISFNDKECTQYTDIILQSGNQLLSIINDLVDIANIESGQVKLNIQQFDLNNSLITLYEQYHLNEKKVTVILNRANLVDRLMIMADGTKLVQILTNLINNAIKFTKEGEVIFGYTLHHDHIEFNVKDSGIGIPADFHSKIFDRFFQVDNRGLQQFGGTGLGLSICKAYVELMGGRIWLESQPGAGTEFYFTLPYIPAPQTVGIN